MLLVCAELPPRPKVQPSSSRQPTSDSTLTNASAPGVNPSPSSPTADRPPVSRSSSDSTCPTLQAIALYDFDGDASLGDLVFRAGETIVEVRSLSTEWMTGRIGDRTGNFPTSFVQISWSWIAWYAGQFITWLSWNNVLYCNGDCLLASSCALYIFLSSFIMYRPSCGVLKFADPIVVSVLCFENGDSDLMAFLYNLITSSVS